MQPTSLSHSDQIVATLAKLPVTTFGTAYTKEVALVLARHMNKIKDWSTCLYQRYIANAVGCTTRTVRTAIRRLEAINFIDTEHRKHDKIDNWNLASVYRLGSALRALFRPPSKPFPAKSSTSFKQIQGNKDRAPVSSSVDKFAMFDHKRAAMTQEDWETSQKASQANNRNALQKLKALFGRGES